MLKNSVLLQNKLSNVNDSLEKLIAKFKTMRIAFANIPKSQRRELQNQAPNYIGNFNRLHEQINTLTDQKQELEQRLEGITSELSTVKDQLKSTQQSNEDFRARFEILSADIDKLEERILQSAATLRDIFNFGGGIIARIIAQAKKNQRKNARESERRIKHLMQLNRQQLARMYKQNKAEIKAIRLEQQINLISYMGKMSGRRPSAFSPRRNTEAALPNVFNAEDHLIDSRHLDRDEAENDPSLRANSSNRSTSRAETEREAQPSLTRDFDDLNLAFPTASSPSQATSTTASTLDYTFGSESELTEDLVYSINSEDLESLSPRNTPIVRSTAASTPESASTQDVREEIRKLDEKLAKLPSLRQVA